MQLISAYLPIVVLIYLMTRKNSMPSFRALPLTALLLYFIVLIVYQRDPTEVHAAIVDGLLVAWTPILIIAGAIFLFRSMEASGALDIIRRWLNTISANPVAQLMIVGWAFQFLIEGASGFGTPAAIAAPVLVGLGFPAVRVAIFCLILNSVPVTFGAVGTPIWFGLSVVDLSQSELAEIAIKSALLNTLAAPAVVFIALAFVVNDKRQLKNNAVFILASTLACTLPYLFLAQFSSEFPSLVGGLIGLLTSILLAKWGFGLSKTQQKTQETSRQEIPQQDATLSVSNLIKASFPLWGTVLILMLTRIPDLGIKALLLSKTPSLTLSLGSLGDFSISAALVISLNNIFNTQESWSHSLLYVPSLLPFGLIALLTLKIYRRGSSKLVLLETVEQMKKPVIALFGALVFVNLMMMGGNGSAVAQIGQHLAALTGDYWRFFATFLGALGAFFSGSATISNLTFGGIQESIAADLALNKTSILALQSVGAAMGNMVCINNIVAVASVLALSDKEGFIMKRTVIAMLAYGFLAGVGGVFIF